MPYSSVADVPAYVPKAKRKQWLAVFNSAYAAAKKDGKSAKEAEAHAFAEANGVAGPNAKATDDYLTYNGHVLKAVGTSATGFVRATEGPFKCGHCHFQIDGHCTQPEVIADPEVQDDLNEQGFLPVASGDCCNEYEPVKKEKAHVSKQLSKFIPFAKVDEAKRQVWGIVTAELPDKEDEVCDYDKSKPFYEAVIKEMSKATNGQNFFPLREMHQLDAAGKCVGFEFRDSDKEIFMGFKVVDDEAWKKVQEGVYTGFSQGGRIVGDLVPDPVYKGCMRYVADPSEVSLVDNPCLGVAHFAYIKTDGTTEMRKFKRVEPVGSGNGNARIAAMEHEISLLKAAITDRPSLAPPLAKGKTKRVAGEDLPSSAFAYVGDPERTETWKLPIKFSTDAKSASHIRNALARFSSTKGIPEGEKDKVWNRIVAAAKEHGIDVSEEKAKLASVVTYVRKRARMWVNKSRARLQKTRVHRSVLTLDDDLGRLQKGMYEVGRLACYTQELAYLVYQCQSEQEWEMDKDSKIPAQLVDNVDSLIDTLLDMLAEESEELRDELKTRVHGPASSAVAASA